MHQIKNKDKHIFTELHSANKQGSNIYLNPSFRKGFLQKFFDLFIGLLSSFIHGVKKKRSICNVLVFKKLHSLPFR